MMMMTLSRYSDTVASSRATKTWDLAKYYVLLCCKNAVCKPPFFQCGVLANFPVLVLQRLSLLGVSHTAVCARAKKERPVAPPSSRIFEEPGELFVGDMYIPL